MFSFVNGNYFQIGGNYIPNSQNIEHFFATPNPSGPQPTDQGNQSQEEADHLIKKQEQEMDNYLASLHSIHSEVKSEHNIFPRHTAKVVKAKQPNIVRPNLNKKISEAEERSKRFKEKNRSESEDVINRTKQKLKKIKQEDMDRKAQQEKHQEKLQEERKTNKKRLEKKKQMLTTEKEEKSRVMTIENKIREEKRQEAIDKHIGSVQRASQEMGEQLDKSLTQNISSEINKVNSERQMLKQTMSENLNSQIQKVNEERKLLSQNMQQEMSKTQQDVSTINQEK